MNFRSDFLYLYSGNPPKVPGIFVLIFFSVSFLVGSLLRFFLKRISKKNKEKKGNG